MIRLSEHYESDRYSFCNEKALAMLDYFYSNADKYDICGANDGLNSINSCLSNGTISNNNNNNSNNNNNINNNNSTLNNNNLSSSTETICTADEQPDPDYIKMFVGQVPKSMDEDQLREMFEEFGRVHSINVLRDKVTGVSKGCCFVTFFTRKAVLNAQDALHNVKTLVGPIVKIEMMHHPIQMKPADSENRNERKLFVGMLNKKLNETDVRKLFEKHGPIEECTVLRDQNGQSKGCAFVTFASKQAAIGAIKALHQSHTMDGCSAPLVVKFAETQKEKEQKKMQQMQANLWNFAAVKINIGQAATTVTPSILPNPPQQPSPILATDAISPASLHLLQQLQAVGLQHQILQGLNTQTAESAAAAAAASLLPPMNIQNLAALAAMTQPSITAAATQQPSAQLTNAAALLCLLGKTANTERKLFVGMLNKKLNETDVRKLFEKHGPIEECTVLRDQNGQSKGCAFVTFASKQAAIGAIKALHQSHTMDGCSAPLVVKFAETQKEKEQKKMQQMQANLWNFAAVKINIGQAATTVTPSILPNPPQQPSPILATDAISPASLHLLQQLQAVGLQHQILQGLNTQTAESAAAAAAASLLPPMNIQNLAALAAMTQPSITAAATQQPSAQLTNAAALLWSEPNLTQAYVSAALPQLTSPLSASSALGSVPLSTAVLTSKQIEDGANLFIYHLPQEFTDTDLATTFLPFGTVISAKVFIDKQTNLSKCFGFVSYDNHESAQAAIKAMHGFQIGTKRLKVQLKKPKEASKPY